MSPTAPRYVIVQAGGRGGRLASLTANKPKCLLSIDGEPLLYRLFRQAPDARFIVVTDTHADVLASYLGVVPPPVPLTLVRATGTGSAAGLANAVELVTQSDAPFLVVWCDLFLEDGLPGFAFADTPIIGLSDRFRCRWSVDDDGTLAESPSEERGVAGFFSFPSRASLPPLPSEGQFVRFLRDHGPRMTPMVVPGIREFGTVAAVTEYADGDRQTRFFNEITFGEHTVVKRSRVLEFDGLITAEADWYERVSKLDFPHVPRLHARKPLTLDRIDGVHPFEVEPAAHRAVLERIADCLADLHALHLAPADAIAVRTMYLRKTLDRIERIRPLIPNVREPTLTVNGVQCRNPLHPRYESLLPDAVASIGVAGFALIHGDPTFSNMLVTRHHEVRLIDPRGTFGAVAFNGDPRYDWAKLLYSVEGNYDQFNRRHFRLRVDGADVRLAIASNGWEEHGPALRERAAAESPATDERALNVIHAVIWLALSGYVLDDVDSILGAFYNGVAHLEGAGP